MIIKYLVLFQALHVPILLASFGSTKHDLLRFSFPDLPSKYYIGNDTELICQKNESIFFNSENLIYKYDQVTLKPKLKPFRNGFFKSKCFPTPAYKDWEEFCIFINPTINHGKGMVIVASESTLEESFNSGMDLSDDPPNARAIKVVKAPEKGGMGAVAAFKLQHGDTVLAERPVGLFPISTFWSSPPGQSIRRQAIDHLPIYTRAAVARLHGIGLTVDEFLSDVIEKNVFSTKLTADSIGYGTLVLLGSRLNHACRPNVNYYVDKRTQLLRMSAFGTIEAGEELTDSYRALDMLGEDRRHSLKSEYGFDCTCSYCKMSAEGRKLSDERITRMQELHSEAYDENGSISADGVEELLNLSEMEKIPWWITIANSIAAEFYNSRGKIDKVKHHANLARNMGLLLAGTSWSDLPDLELLLSSPEKHSSHFSRG